MMAVLFMLFFPIYSLQRSNLVILPSFFYWLCLFFFQFLEPFFSSLVGYALFIKYKLFLLEYN